MLESLILTLISNFLVPELKKLVKVRKPLYQFLNFKLKKEERIKIIIAETYPRIGSDWKVSSKGIRATGEGQVYALKYLLPFLAVTFGPERIDLKFCQKEENLLNDNGFFNELMKGHYILLGGPINNSWTRAIMRKYKTRYTYGYVLKDEEREKKEKDEKILELDDHVLYDRALKTAIKPHKEIDYGLIIQIPSANHEDFCCCILSGNTTRGTAGAAMALANPKYLKEINRKILTYNKNHHKTGGCFYFQVVGEIEKMQIAENPSNFSYGELECKV